MSEDSHDPKERLTSSWLSFKYGGALAVGIAAWLYGVSSEVNGVYLDEEFHVRQALVYADNKFDVWDSKITTPPGLYLVAYAWLFLLQKLKIPGLPVLHLRGLNAVGLLALWLVAWRLSDAIQAERQPKLKADQSPKAKASAQHYVDKRRQTTAHVALNVALFPPLFFFAALFYTDVLSALSVLLAHLAFYKRNTPGVLLASLASLFFRQTNIFWTAVYLAGLETQRRLQRLRASRHGRKKPGADLSWMSIAQLSWERGEVYDPSAPVSSLEDYLKCGLSLVLAALSNIQHLIVPLMPYMLLLASFLAFVVLNGGVVLGDKSNHVASLHIPQVLYTWPCFAFFSFPIFGTTAMMLAALIMQRFSPTPSVGGEWNIPDAKRLPRWSVLALFTVLALAAVYWNTIVHPFILADNRHYTFYVFRLLLRHPLIKYLVTPIYVACGWACLSAGIVGSEARRKASISSTKTSTVLIWLLATTASLATAPLVEPRYFILPWIIWRLNLNIPPIEDSEEWDGNDTSIANLEREVLGFETNWMVIVNLIVAYIFLSWRFEWPQEPGKIMRFMW